MTTCIRKICRTCKRSPTNLETNYCQHCERYTGFVPDRRAEELYEVCTQCAHPRFSRGNGQCTAAHPLATEFRWMNVLEHRSLRQQLAEPEVTE